MPGTIAYFPRLRKPSAMDKVHKINKLAQILTNPKIKNKPI